MSPRTALLMPVAALALVALGAVVTLARRDESGAAAPVAPTPTAAPAVTQLKPESNVCQGVLHRPDPGQPRTFPPIYTQKATAKGITVVADAKVDPRALDVARETIERVFKNNSLVARLVEQGAYVIIADRNQGVLDLPEFGCLQGQVSASFFSHVCGVADRADYPVATANELDMIGDRKGPCGGLDILFHELGHLVQGWTLEPADYFDVKLMYQAALTAGKYKGAYAATNTNEYFAEATQSYFYHGQPDGTHDRAWLKQYDPEIYALLARIYGD